MNRSIWKNSFAGIAVTVTAVSFGYLAVQYFGKYMTLAVGTGMFGLGVAIHRTQQSLPQASLPEAPIFTEFNPELISLAATINASDDTSETEVKEPQYQSKNQINATASRHSMTVSSRVARSEVNLTKTTRNLQSSGYCRKRLALCHKAKLESSKKASP